MKKEIKYILFSLLLSLSACGNVGGNASLPNESSHTSSSKEIVNSSSNNNDNNNNDDDDDVDDENSMINKNASKILKAQDNISKTIDTINNAQVMSLRKERRRKSLSNDGLNGEFIQGSFDPGPLVKMTSEPLSYAFATLEGLIATNNADVDINDKTFYFSNNNTPIRINYFEEHSDYVFIRYSDYRMLINSDEENTFVLSFSTGNNDSIWMNYETLTTSLTYWNSDKAWQEEIEALINSLDLYNEDSINGEPLRYIKSIFEKENNDLDAWKENGSNILNECEYTYMYMHHRNLRNMYYARYDEFLGSNDDIEIIDNKLVKINSLTKNTFLDVPLEVKEISKLTKKNDHQKVYALHLPTTVINIEEGALNDLGVELLFVDYIKEEISEELYNTYLNSGDNIRILFKDQWTITHDLYIPNEYYYSVLDSNTFNISLKGLMKDFNKIYEFEEFLTKEDYQKYLDLMYEYCDLIINTLEDVNNILQLKVEYFDSVISSIYLDVSEYCFYYINDLNEEVIVDNVDGSKFLELELHIKKIEKVEEENKDKEETEEDKEENKDEEIKDDEFGEVK